ncbi:hypothetical protein [Microbacterium sp. NPDC078849]|uniref:hypothetical protein n=1 Tax=unclassified Microbacterium TaxID=2609290 RepID=UPI00344CF807
MDRWPISPKVRHRYEAIIRIIDLFAYFAVFIGGVYALVGTPNSIVDELAGWEWLILLWAFLLLVGGAAGFLGRFLRWWMIEVPATVLATFGIGIYFIVLGRFAFASITSAVAVALVCVAMLVMVRRYAELQIFATEPGTDFRTRVAAALRRRTPDVVRRHR